MVHAPYAESVEGDPPYPLYKHLAAALLESINSKTFCRTQSRDRKSVV